MSETVSGIPQEQAANSEHQQREYAGIMAKGIRESKPKFLSTFVGSHAESIMLPQDITIGELQIHVDTEHSSATHAAGLLGEAIRMRYGIRVGQESHVAASTNEIVSALGESTKDATAPVLFELARQYDKLSLRTIQEADDLGVITVATSTRPDQSSYTTIYFADGQSGKMIRFQLDALPRPVTISPADITEIRREIASSHIQEALRVIPQQALAMRIEDDGGSVSITAPNGNVWKVPLPSVQTEQERLESEESGVSPYAEELTAKARQVTDEDLQRRSDEVGEELRDLFSLPEDEAAQKMLSLREWMGSRGYEIPVNYDYKYAYLMLSSQEKADFEEWGKSKGEVSKLVHGLPSEKPEERTEPFDMVYYGTEAVVNGYLGTTVIQELDSHTGHDVYDLPTPFRMDPAVAKHGGLPAFWQEHGGDFGNGVIETAGLQLVFAGLAFAFARGRVTYNTLTRLRLLAAGLSMLSVAFYELRPLADFTNQHIMNIGQPDALDAPAGVLGAGTPTVIDAALSKYLQLRHRKKMKRIAVGKHMGIEGMVEDILEGVNKAKNKLKSLGLRSGNK